MYLGVASFVGTHLLVDSDVLSWNKNCVVGPFAFMFLAGIWWIWRSRCKETISGEALAECEVLRNISFLAKDIFQFLSHSRLVSWLRPPMDFFKLDVDGSSLGNLGQPGIGGLIRRVDGS